MISFFKDFLLWRKTLSKTYVPQDFSMKSKPGDKIKVILRGRHDVIIILTFTDHIDALEHYLQKVKQLRDGKLDIQATVFTKKELT